MNRICSDAPTTIVPPIETTALVVIPDTEIPTITAMDVPDTQTPDQPTIEEVLGKVRQTKLQERLPGEVRTLKGFSFLLYCIRLRK